MDIKTAAELQNRYPELAAELLKAAEASAHERGVNDERERLKALDGLIRPGREEVIDKAKYEEPKSVQDAALDLLKADETQNALDARAADAEPLNNIARGGPATNTTAIKEETLVENVASAINERRGYTR